MPAKPRKRAGCLFRAWSSSTCGAECRQDRQPADGRSSARRGRPLLIARGAKGLGQCLVRGPALAFGSDRQPVCLLGATRAVRLRQGASRRPFSPQPASSTVERGTDNPVIAVRFRGGLPACRRAMCTHGIGAPWPFGRGALAFTRDNKLKGRAGAFQALERAVRLRYPAPHRGHSWRDAGLITRAESSSNLPAATTFAQRRYRPETLHASARSGMVPISGTCVPNFGMQPWQPGRACSGAGWANLNRRQHADSRS